MTSPNFSAINVYNVAIVSLKNKLKSVTDIDELIVVSKKIIELEKKIFAERSAVYKDLEKKKQQIEQRIAKINKALEAAQDELKRITISIDVRVNSYKKSLETRIETLSKEFAELSEQLTDYQSSDIADDLTDDPPSQTADRQITPAIHTATNTSTSTVHPSTT